MQLIRQGKIVPYEDNVNTNVVNPKTTKILDIETLYDIYKQNDNFLKSNVFNGGDVVAIMFFDGDLHLGGEPHNRSLFVSCYTHEQKVNRILIDGKCAVNIIPPMTSKELRIQVEELSSNRLTS